MTRDPYRYFRIEAVELAGGLAEGLLALEREDHAEVMPRLRRHAHTLKGAARIVKRPDIADRAHRIEDLLGVEGAIDVDAALALVDEIRACIAELGAPAAPPSQPRVAAEPQTSSELRVLRLDVSELDRLLEDVVTARATVANLSRELAALDRAADDARALASALAPGSSPPPASYVFESVGRLAHTLESTRRALVADERSLESELDELTGRATSLRLVPAAALVSDLERAARDAARHEGKAVRFVSRGADTRLDIQVLGGLRGALVHLVRNAVAHGIEATDERVAAGKPEAGLVELTIESRGQRVAFVCKDDGAGVDVARIRDAAMARGLIDDANADDDDVLELAWHVGVTTRSGISVVAGRGVGLDVVRDAVDRIGGQRLLRTRAGVGTEIELVVPSSLSAMPALEVSSDGESTLIPLDAIREAILVDPDAISSTADGAGLVTEGEIIPFVPLGRAMRRVRSASEPPHAAVIVEAAGRRAAVGVDRLGRVHNVVVHLVPEVAAADPIVAGAAFDQGGAPRLVLAPPALVDAARASAVEPSASRQPSRARVRVLVIDDSLTTRMLEQSILEAAGYDVTVAVSAEDALERIAESRFDLFLVDVEMPGMSGFDFVAHTQREPALRDVPAILVTSRDSEADRERGLSAGARAYLVKSEFDQRRLLTLIDELVHP